jgi:hypothetical protein
MRPRRTLAAAIATVVLLCACDESSPKSDQDASSSSRVSASTSADIGDAVVAAYQTPIGDQTVLDGVWRVHARRADMLAAGVDSRTADSNVGTWTFAIHDGDAHVNPPKGPHCLMKFVFAKGRKVYLNAEIDRCGGFAIGTYKRDGRAVTFNWLATLDENAGKWTPGGATPLFSSFFQRGMTRMGDG